MPLANFKYIKEVTSEDSTHKASNLLKMMMPGKKWKTKNLGEKSAYVIFELDQAHLITGIDIGNEHSAFVEVLVGNSYNSGEEFKEILITSSFMTPTESRNSTQINRVRCFGQNDLVEVIASKKWSLIKVLCTQPFNKHVQYGLCFIKVHVEDSNMNCKDTLEKHFIPEKCLSKYASQNLKNSEPVQNIGSFTLREDSPESDPDTSKGLFARWKMSHKEENLPETDNTVSKELPRSRNDQILLQYNTKGKAATPSDKSKVICEEVPDRNRYELLFCEEDDKRNRRLEKHILADSKDLLLNMEKNKKRRSKKSVEVQAQETSDTKNFNSNILKPSEILNEYTNEENPFSANKRPIKRIKPDRTIKCVAFEKLFLDVVLVISGIQNPDRAELREKALAMGARYKADWDNSCTHLICAFKNTPKYNQVKGKGKIVTRIWIEQCFTLKKRLPWRRYAVDSTEKNHPESEEEIFAESTESKNATHSVKQTEPTKNCDKALYDFDNITMRATSFDSNSDNEDDLKNCKNLVSFENKATTSEIDVYDDSTEEEEYLQYRLKHYKK